MDNKKSNVNHELIIARIQLAVDIATLILTLIAIFKS